MTQPSTFAAFVSRGALNPAVASKIGHAGRSVAFAGVLLPLVMIGALKFTQIETEALKPLISNTPWLAWLYLVFGETGTSRLLGTVELITAALLIASLWRPWAGIVGGLIAASTFLVTVSTLFALPIWEAGSGGFPWLNFVGTFLIKDVALLGISLVVLAEGQTRALHSDVE